MYNNPQSAMGSKGEQCGIMWHTFRPSHLNILSHAHKYISYYNIYHISSHYFSLLKNMELFIVCRAVSAWHLLFYFGMGNSLTSIICLIRDNTLKYNGQYKSSIQHTKGVLGRFIWSFLKGLYNMNFQKPQRDHFFLKVNDASAQDSGVPLQCVNYTVIPSADVGETV